MKLITTTMQRGLFVIAGIAGLLIVGCSAGVNSGTTPTLTQGSGTAARSAARFDVPNTPCNTFKANSCPGRGSPTPPPTATPPPG